MCLRKPIVVTCGADKTVRIWNYAEKTCELVRHFAEEPVSVAMHPSGFALVVGFSEKLRAMNLLMEDIRTYKEVGEGGVVFVGGCWEQRWEEGRNFVAGEFGRFVSDVIKMIPCPQFGWRVVISVVGDSGWWIGYAMGCALMDGPLSSQPTLIDFADLGKLQ